MPQERELFDQYQRSVENLLQHYIDLYLSICSGTPNVYAGKEFIEIYNATYKKELMDAVTNFITESVSTGSKLYYRIMKQNQLVMNALFERIMNLSLGVDRLNKNELQ
jgi:hypothetical protein